MRTSADCIYFSFSKHRTYYNSRYRHGQSVGILFHCQFIIRYYCIPLTIWHMHPRPSDQFLIGSDIPHTGPCATKAVAQTAGTLLRSQPVGAPRSLLCLGLLHRLSQVGGRGQDKTRRIPIPPLSFPGVCKPSSSFSRLGYYPRLS